MPSMTGGPSLAPSSLTRRLIGVPDGLRAQREDVGLTMFRFYARVGEVRPVRRQREGHNGGLRSPPSLLHTVWCKPVSAFGLLIIMTVIRRSPPLTFPRDLRSAPP